LCNMHNRGFAFFTQAYPSLAWFNCRKACLAARRFSIFCGFAGGGRQPLKAFKCDSYLCAFPQATQNMVLPASSKKHPSLCLIKSNI
jgi:hypothetical protein